ncbi:MAG: peptidase [Rhizobacter sp.]|nr:peptidase [Rhizobacter sp.]
MGTYQSHGSRHDAANPRRPFGRRRLRMPTLLLMLVPLTLVLLTIALLAGCGGGSGGGGGGGSNTGPASADQPHTDTLAYGSGPDDSVSNVSEPAAITRHRIDLGGVSLAYTATAGHLVAVDPLTSQPTARIFYVAYTADGPQPAERPVTFVYNGGPGSSSVTLLLGSFGPTRIKTSLPDFTPPAPYTLEANPDTLLDKTDLVFINPVGTGFSSAVAPAKNRDFWSVDTDAASLVGFIQRYLSRNERWNSPKFLMGESYGTPRSAVMSFALHRAGIELNGITLISSVLSMARNGSIDTQLPSHAAAAWYHKKARLASASLPLQGYLDEVRRFVDTRFAPALKPQLDTFDRLNRLLFDNPDAALGAQAFDLAQTVRTYQELIALLARGSPAQAALAVQAGPLLAPPAPIDPAIVQTAADATGLDVSLFSAASIEYWPNFQRTLLASEGKLVGAYDGRATGAFTGIAALLPMEGGLRDPAMVAISGAYTAAWNTYLSQSLKYSATSSFQNMNLLLNSLWDWRHADPAGQAKGGRLFLYTAGDLAATMMLNPDLKVFQASGVYDSVTPFMQTEQDLRDMPVDAARQAGVKLVNYPSGHMIYLDPPSRTAMKTDLAAFYDSTLDARITMRIRALQDRTRAAAGLPAVPRGSAR